MTPWQDELFIVAEAGVNHNGNLDMARKLIDGAAAAGCSAVKFQTFRAEAVAASFADKADYQMANTGEGERQREMLKRLELPCEAHQMLMEHAEQQGIQFFSTAFDFESIDFLGRLGIPLWKIPSGEITNYPYLLKIAAMGKPILLSTGMATIAEIDDAVRVIEQYGADRGSICVLHCNTEYPTPWQDVNLRAMANLGRTFGMVYGYSDHTLGVEVPIAAVALGARVIEKHFTLDRSLPGPDHRVSLEPNELKAMVAAIRNIELALGDGIKRPSRSEEKNRVIVRKSLVAARPIRAGEAFCRENITAKRPGTGLSPMRWNEIIGRRASRDFAFEELIEL